MRAGTQPTTSGSQTCFNRSRISHEQDTQPYLSCQMGQRVGTPAAEPELSFHSILCGCIDPDQ